MKSTGLLKFWAFGYTAVLILLTSIGCEKKTVENTAPHVYTGYDQFVYFPADSCQLKGESFDMQNNIVSHSWEKVSGPDNYAFDDAGSLTTGVRNLEVGKYEFELTATDKYGLQARDTVNVNVIQPGNNEVLFNDVAWECSWGCAVSIESIYSFAPAGFSVFLRRRDSSPWEGVSYDMYNVYEGDLFIYSYGEESGTVDIKITF